MLVCLLFACASFCDCLGMVVIACQLFSVSSSVCCQSFPTEVSIKLP